MVLDYLLYGMAFLGLFVGSFSDLKTREVPDWVSYSMIFGGLGLRLIFSLANFEWMIFFEGLIGFIVFVVLAYLIYYFGQWGGGDAKLLMGLGAVIGLNLNFSAMPKLAVFLINLALISTVYGIGWLVVLAASNKKKFLDEFKKQQKQVRILSFVFLAAAVFLFLSSFFVPGIWKGAVLVLGIIPVGSLYIWVLTSVIEKISFFKRVSPEDLTEGDWIAKDVMVQGEKICGPRDLGISEEQISKLIELKKKGKIHKILIKEGIPFVPSFLFAFIVTIAWGSWWMGFIP